MKKPTWKDLLPPEQGINIMEICCPPDSRLTQTFLDRGRQAIRVECQLTTSPRPRESVRSRR